MKSLFLLVLRAYKLTISPFLGQNCRFYPSCSSYAESAIRRHGVVKGSLLTGKRLCKCHPWHAGGVDLVPEEVISTDQSCNPPSQIRLKLARFDRVKLGGKRADHTTHISKHASDKQASDKHVTNKQASNQPSFTTE